MCYFTKDDLNKLWKPITGTSVLPFPSREEFAALEQRLGVKLPASYIELAATTQNGGELNRNGVALHDEDGNVFRHVKISEISAIGHRLGDKSVPKRMPGHEGFDLPKRFYNKENLFIIGQNRDANSEFFVLNYMDCGSTGEPNVVFITRKSVRGADNEPMSGDWRYISEKFYWDITSVAPNFEAFIKGLVVMPRVTSFDFSTIKEPLKQAVQESFRCMVNEHGIEEIISYGLYVDDEGSMVADAANTKAHLESRLAKHPAEKDYFTFSTSEWRYEGMGYALHLFEPICKELSVHSRALGSDDKIKRFRDKLIDLCVEILAELKADSYFLNEYGLPLLLSVGISNGEISSAKLKKIHGILA